MSDVSGDVLFASNPDMARVDLNRYFKSDGDIIITVRKPELRYGKFFISLYFGDGSIDSIAYENCLSFEIDSLNVNKKMGKVKSDCVFTYC